MNTWSPALLLNNTPWNVAKKGVYVIYNNINKQAIRVGLSDTDIGRRLTEHSKNPEVQQHSGFILLATWCEINEEYARRGAEAYLERVLKTAHKYRCGTLGVSNSIATRFKRYPYIIFQTLNPLVNTQNPIFIAL